MPEDAPKEVTVFEVQVVRTLLHDLRVDILISSIPAVYDA